MHKNAKIMTLDQLKEEYQALTNNINELVENGLNYLTREQYETVLSGLVSDRITIKFEIIERHRNATY